MRIDDLEFRDKNGNEINPTKQQMGILISQLNKENKRLKEQLKERTVDYWELQDMQLKNELIKMLKKQLAITKKALELICYYMEYEYQKKDDDIWYRKDKELYMYFINKAKESIE